MFFIQVCLNVCDYSYKMSLNLFIFLNNSLKEGLSTLIELLVEGSHHLGYDILNSEILLDMLAEGCIWKKVSSIAC